MSDEHKINLEIKRKKENYYVTEDKHEMISPEQGIVILDKYTTIKKINLVRKDLNDAWSKINDKIKPMHLLRKKEE